MTLLIINLIVLGLIIGSIFYPPQFTKTKNIEESEPENREEKEMLKSVKDLGDIEVYDVMNHRKNLFSIDIDLPTSEIVKKIKISPYSRVPLYKDKPDNIVGVIRIKYLLQECVDKNNDFNKIKITELMSKPWFIPDNTTLLQQ